MYVVICVGRFDIRICEVSARGSNCSPAEGILYLDCLCEGVGMHGMKTYLGYVK